MFSGPSLCTEQVVTERSHHTIDAAFEFDIRLLVPRSNSHIGVGRRSINCWSCGTTEAWEIGEFTIREEWYRGKGAELCYEERPCERI